MTLFSKVSDIYSITITKRISDANCVSMSVLKFLHMLCQVQHLSGMLPFGTTTSFGYRMKLKYGEPESLVHNQ